MKLHLYIFLILCFTAVTKAQAQQCSGYPTAGTITNLYPNTPVGGIDTLLLSGTSTDSGIVFYWQASGPVCMPFAWAVIAGSGSNKLAVTVPSGPIAYRVIVQCVNSGYNSYTNAIGINYGTCCNTTIWPGETNQDDTVNNNDVLPLVCRFGKTGPARNNATISWSPQTCSPWTNTYGCINLMHLDCNGDGVIDGQDTAAITQNYDTTHIRQDETPTIKINGRPDLYFNLSGLTFTPGATVTVPIMFGNATTPVLKLAAMAATMRIGGISLNVPLVMNFDTSWLTINAGVNKLRFSKKITNNKTDWAFGRTDGHNQAGYGRLCTVTFTVPTNVSAGQQIVFQLEHVKGVDSNGTAISPFNVVSDTAIVSTTSIAAINPAVTVNNLFPNPANSKVYIKLTADKQQIINLGIYDLTGRLVRNTIVKAAKGSNAFEISVSDLQPGTYFFKLLSDGQLQTYKLVKE